MDTLPPLTNTPNTSTLLPWSLVYSLIGWFNVLVLPQFDGRGKHSWQTQVLFIQFTTVLTKNKDILYSRNIDHVSRHLYPYDNNFCINKHIYPSALCQVQKYSIEIGIDRQQQMFGDFKQIDVLFHF